MTGVVWILLISGDTRVCTSWMLGQSWANYMAQANTVPETVLTFVLPVQVPKDPSVI